MNGNMQNTQMYDEEWGQFVYFDGDTWKYRDVMRDQVSININTTASPIYHGVTSLYNNDKYEPSLTHLCATNIAYGIICVYNFIVR
tara:strand:- start:605 stop:862 length:258 start_codon:yes stop_codon:yes gene_type:complete